MNIVIDIETIPDQSPNAIDRYLSDDVKVSCPHKTKAAIGADLGMDESEYKFIGAEDLKQKWIERKGDEAKKEQATAKWLKTSFDGGYGKICCVCFSFNGQFFTFVNGSEREFLADLWDKLNEILNGRHPNFIAHNAKFDLPFLYHRSVVNGVKPIRGFKPHGRHGQDYFCTMEAWAGFNGKIGLNRLAEILSLGQKGNDMSGADVWPEYQKGNIEKIASYCKQDVQLTSDVYDRLTFKTSK